MAQLTNDQRQAIARRRLVSVLTTNTVATWRTLEQKIADAGPSPQRIDPHALTEARNDLINTGVVVQVKEAVTYFHLASVSPDVLKAKLSLVRPIWVAVRQHDVTLRMGQALEIAAYRAFIQQTAFQTFGGFLDLDEHEDHKLYKKEEPPSSISGRTCTGKLDFLLLCSGDLIGVELKNIREWLYPDRKEVREFIEKCVALDALPVLIARRIPFVTFKVLNSCGIIIHQTYNQLYANADAAIAAKARDKHLLGFHDIRIGNLPDKRMLKFVNHNLPGLVPEMRQRFNVFKDLLQGFVSNELKYPEFAARVRRRTEGTNEDNDFSEDDQD